MSTIAKPTSAPIRRTAAAIGVSPTTSTRGAGSTGSRKTSIAPPERQGFWTVTAPSASSKTASSTGAGASSLKGRIRSSTAWFERRAVSA